MDKRVRSPNYPAVGLQEAVNRVGALYKVQHTHLAPREVVAKGLGYSSLNGASATAISALLKYGLIDREGEDLKVSERAMKILHPHSPQEKAAAIRDAAAAPALFAELLEKFPGQMPNDDLLRNYLVRRGFAESALSAVISAYRETSEMANREAGAYDDIETQPEDSPMQTVAPQQPFQNPNKFFEARVVQSPPKAEALEGERSLGRYDFEGGRHVRIVASDNLNTEEALDMAETLIELKRKELARKKSLAISAVPVDNENEEKQ